MPTGVYVRTHEYRAKMSVAMKNRVLSEEAKSNMRKAAYRNIELARIATGGHGPNLGRKMSDEQKKKLSLALKGRRPVTSPEIIEKISKALRGRKNPLLQGKNSPLWKHGLCYTKEYIKNMKQRRLAFERGGGPLTTATVRLVYEDNIKKYGTLTCIYCLKPVEFGNDTLEHLTPLFRGGTNEYSNLAVACRLCNSRKRHMNYQEYVEKYGRGQGVPGA